MPLPGMGHSLGLLPLACGHWWLQPPAHSSLAPEPPPPFLHHQTSIVPISTHIGYYFSP
jgi:hypothetical protein